MAIWMWSMLRIGIGSISLSSAGRIVFLAASGLDVVSEIVVGVPFAGRSPVCTVPNCQMEALAAGATVEGVHRTVSGQISADQTILNTKLPGKLGNRKRDRSGRSGFRLRVQKIECIGGICVRVSGATLRQFFLDLCDLKGLRFIQHHDMHAVRGF